MKHMDISVIVLRFGGWGGLQCNRLCRYLHLLKAANTKGRRGLPLCEKRVNAYVPSVILYDGKSVSELLCSPKTGSPVG